METNKSEKKYTWILFFLIVLPLALYFWFALDHLGQFETADEHLWVSNLYTGRIQEYWDAMAQKDWPSTHINDKPGVSLAYVSGIGSWFEKSVRSKIIEKQNLWTIYNPAKQKETYYLYRLPIVIFNGLMSLFFCLAFWQLTKKHWLALSAAAFILLSPVLLGISQIINPDSLLWSFSFASLLSYLLFLKKTRFVYGFLAALFLGFALLSKYVAILLIPFFLAVLLSYLWFDYPQFIDQKNFRKKTALGALGYILIVVGGIGLFALLMPAAIVDRSLLYDSILNFNGNQEILMACACLALFLFLDALILKSTIVKFFTKYLQFLKPILPKAFYLAMFFSVAAIFVTWSLDYNFLHLPGFKIDGQAFQSMPAYQQLLFQARPLVYALTPATLFLILFLWIKSIFQKSDFDYLVFIFSVFIIIYLATISKMNVMTSVRYSIMLYPAALALSGIGFYELVKNLKLRYSLVLFLFILGSGILSLQKIKPFYFNYISDLLPKKTALSTSWGYGGYEAVNFINSQADPKNMKIWTNYYGVCPFFPGKCVAEGQVKWMKDADVANIDYVVLSQPGMKKNDPGLQSIHQIFPTDNPVWELDIDGRPDNFVKVYKNPLKQ